MSTYLNRDKFLRPETVLSDLLRKNVQGQIKERSESGSQLFRALVVAVDVEGGLLENPAGSGVVKHELNGRSFEVRASVGPENPRNSVKARLISGGLDQFLNDDALRVFWPFFPEHISIPVKPGEHVYVMFEGEGMEHGLWVSKVSGHENLNMYRGRDSYKNTGDLSSKFGDPSTQDEPLNSDQDSTQSSAKNHLKNLFSRRSS